MKKVKLRSVSFDSVFAQNTNHNRILSKIVLGEYRGDIAHLLFIRTALRCIV